MKSRRVSVVFWLCVLAVLGACGKEPGYRIEGDVPGAEGYAVLSYDTPDGESVRDTAVLKNGKYVFRGSVEDVVMGSVKVFPEGKDPTHAFLYVENAPLTIADGRATGGPNNDFLHAMDGAGDGVEKDDPDYPAKIRQALLDFVKSYPDVEAAAFMYYNFSRDLPYEELEAGYNAFSDRVKNSFLAGRLREELVSRKAIRPGLEAPDFSLKDREGKAVSLSSLRGRTVLVDFWASWCKPCRASMPGLKELYGKYHDKGFEILGVSVDSSAEPWIQAVSEDGTPWIHVLDESQGKNRPTRAAQLYGVHAVPSFFLVDPEGKLIGKMDHDTLETALADLLD
jgi:peroxiredoxin